MIQREGLSSSGICGFFSRSSSISAETMRRATNSANYYDAR
jgi:hypothetical protein